MSIVTVAVITVSDRASRGEYQDLSGPRIREVLQGAHPDWQVGSSIVADEASQIHAALQEALGRDFILTTGGTGLGPRDITPEVCRAFCDRELPGIAEALRFESYKETPLAMISRGYAGLKDQTIVVNFPGSPRGAEFCARLLLPIMDHAVEMLQGKGHF